MTLKTTPWDSAEYLKTEKDIADYLEAVMAEGGDDPAFVAHALGVVARARNMSQLARDAGMTREGLYKALSAGGNPSFATVTKVAGALGLRVSFRPAPRRTGAKPQPSAKPRPSAKPAKGGKRAVKGKQVKVTNTARVARRKVA